ncbi:MAG: ATP-binding cassette domain-containing protein [Ardenticatenales bacterium]|nr:ATP-binding cassette domain-containing protein [Ardenticatenales bacterium]
MAPLISVENLSYAYPGDSADDDPVWVLDGVDLRLEPGEFVAVMGATGGGKTTLCLALNGIVPQSTGGVIGGQVLVNGQNTKQTPVAELAQTVGLVFQNAETQLFNVTVEAEIAFGLETLGLPPAEMETRIDWALELVGLAGFRARSPFELSGGQKQRVAIAAMLALKPPVLVLDEPTANLDPAGKQEIFAAIDRLRHQESMTIVMVSHEADQIATFADRVVVLANGKIALSGTPQQIFLPPGPMQALGLHVPGLAELADCLTRRGGQRYCFLDGEAAYDALAAPLLPSVGQVSTAVDSLPPANGTLQLEQVSHSYSPGQSAIKRVDLTIPAGDFVAILGQNGSGKTTLVKHLNGLLRPSHGRILLNGEDIARQSVAELARTVGYVFQNPDHMIYSATVREELAAGPINLGLDEATVADRVAVALADFSLLPFADMQPAQLSFGLRRKVSVASVVTMGTPILILDEPTSGLDQRSIDELMAILVGLHAQGRTILMITHDMELVIRHLPRTLIMKAGELLAYDATTRIFCRPQLLDMAQLACPPVARLGQRLGWAHELLNATELCQRLEAA